ncbi:MAG: DUF5679 domain-containing protein [Anaerolineae bacterium]
MSRFGFGLVVGFCAGFWAVCKWLWVPPERRRRASLRLDLADQVPPRRAPSTLGEEVVGYCVRCRAKRPMIHAELTATRRGQPAYRGECPVCGTAMFRLLPK